MNADEPRTPAERLRRWVNAGAVLGSHTYATRDELANDVLAVLGAVPDDAKAVNKTWLESVGFRGEAAPAVTAAPGTGEESLDGGDRK